jgi:hypothetical protein
VAEEMAATEQVLELPKEDLSEPSILPPKKTFLTKISVNDGC